MPGELLNVEALGFSPLDFDAGNFVLRLPTALPHACLPQARARVSCCAGGRPLALSPLAALSLSLPSPPPFLLPHFALLLYAVLTPSKTPKHTQTTLPTTRSKTHSFKP